MCLFNLREFCFFSRNIIPPSPRLPIFPPNTMALIRRRLEKLLSVCPSNLNQTTDIKKGKDFLIVE